MNYIFGTLSIIKTKIITNDISINNIPRCNEIIPLYKQYYIFYNESSKIIDRLYLGSCFNALNKSELIKKQINVIINVTNNINNYYENDLDITYYKFPIRDNNIDDITPILIKSFDIIDNHLKNGDIILIHCYMGASRSASIIIYYLIKKYNLSYNYVKKFILQKRNIINLSKYYDDILLNY